MDIYKLNQILAQEEGFKLDFKLELSLSLESEKKEFVKDVTAIANTQGGRGYIIFGIEDQTKKIVGIKNIPDKIEERIQQIICNRSMPPVPVKFEIVEVDKKQVGVLTIYKSQQIPHQHMQTGGFYIRRGSTTDKATRHEIAAMFQEYGMLSFENVPCRSATIDDIDFLLINKYLGKLSVLETQDKLVLQALGIISSDLEKGIHYPTYGGLLLFGKHPQIFIPHASIEISYQGKSILVQGNIIDMLNKFKKEVSSFLPKDYPFEALYEVLSNAVIHRDYWNNTRIIYVKIEEEKITVSNPSSRMINMKGNIEEVKANLWLYSRLLLIQQSGLEFHFGIGLDKVKQLLRGHGTDLTIHNDMTECVFEVTLPGLKYFI